MIRFFVLFTILLFQFTCVFAQSKLITSVDSLPDGMLKFLKSLKEPTEFIEIPDYDDSKPPQFISKQQAHEDVDMIEYLFDNAYSGRFYWESNGFSFENYYSKLHQYINSSSSDRVDVKSFEQYIFDGLTYINDGHTGIEGFSFNYLYKTVTPYYASLVIQKNGDRYYVVESSHSNITVGEEYCDSSIYLFKTLSATNKEQYLIGELSDIKLESLKLKFGDEIKTVELHVSKLSEFKYDGWHDILDIDTLNNIPIIRSSSFGWSEDNAKYLDQFIDYGKNLTDKPIFVWNIIGNTGGDANNAYNFITNFNGLCQEQLCWAVLHSPPTNQCYWENKNDWIFWPESLKQALNDDNYPLDSIPIRKREKIKNIRYVKQYIKTDPKITWEVHPMPKKEIGDYMGKAIILMNNHTGSAANNAVGASKSIPNSILIGENTAPSYSIGNMKWFKLKNTKFVLSIPGVIGYNPDNKMEKGFFPDYWLDSNEPIKEVMDWLDNPDSYQFNYHD